MSTLFQDIRHAFRLWRRTPGLIAVAILSLAITIGITDVVFTALKSVLIDPLPYARPGELVYLGSGGVLSHWVNWSDMEDVRRRNRTLQSVGTYHYALFNLRGDGSNLPQALYGLYVSADLFPTLGVSPMLGRNILPEETLPGRDREVILSYGLWTRRFGSDRHVIGRRMVANGRDYTIIGVMPPGFDFPLRLATTVRPAFSYMEFWAPLALDPDRVDRRSSSFGAVARLKTGISRLAADQDIASISHALALEYPVTNKDRDIRAFSLETETFGSSRAALLILMAAAGMFMLIGCANVANLLLARSVARQREIAVRLALGAKRGRIVRQLITESCVLAVTGGLCGYVLTVAAWALLPAIVPTTVPRLDGSHVDGAIFAFTLAISVANGFLFGMAPALRGLGRNAAFDSGKTLRESGARGFVGPGRNGLRSAVVVAEIAITVVLVIAGGLLTASFVRLLRTNLGFQPGHLLASIIVPQGDAYKSAELWGRFNQRLLDTARTLPGVEAAGMVDALPFSGENNGASIRSDDAGQAQHGSSSIAELDRVTSGYLQTMGVRLLQGRWFTKEDESRTSNAAIVDDVAARRFWAGQNPIGKRLCVGCDEGRPQVWKQVVGVVNTVKHYSLDAPAGPDVYVAAGAIEHGQFLILRTRGRAMDLAVPLQRMVASLDPNVPVYLSREMSTFVGDSVSDRRFTMALLAITAVLALLLAAAGVYAVVSYSTSRRTREMGVRMALGATRGDVQTLVFREGMKVAGAGVLIGLVAAIGTNRVLRGVLMGLGQTDGVTIAIAVTLVTASAAAACLVPAWRATRIDPMAALRHE